MDYRGKTPAELYAEEVEIFYVEKTRLTEIVNSEKDRRRAVLDACPYDIPENTLAYIRDEARKAQQTLWSAEFQDKERMLVLLYPLYAEGVTE